MYSCSAVCGSSAWWLYDRANSDLLQEGLCHTLCDPGLLQPETLSLQKATADLCFHSRHSNTQRQVWLSLCVVSGSWCGQNFVWALQASLAGMGCDSKCDFFSPSYHLVGSSPLPLDMRLSFFGGIEHSQVDSCSAASCKFGVIAGEDEHMSFYSATRFLCPWNSPGKNTIVKSVSSFAKWG